MCPKLGLMSLKNIEQRLLFAHYHLYYKTDFMEWGFSDESKFKMADLCPKYKWIETNI